MARIFLAADFPSDTIVTIKNWQKKYASFDCLRLVPAENLHITLMFFGEVSAEELIAIRQIKQESLNDFGMKLMTLRLQVIKPGPIASNPRLLWIEGESKDLQEYKKTIDFKIYQSQILRKFLEERPFLLHITIARLRGGQKWDFNIPIMTGLNYTTYIQGIHIYESILKKSGSEYRKVA